MTKARVNWLFGQVPVPSAQLDQVTTDWMTNGLPIMGHSGLWRLPPLFIFTGDLAFGWYPYNADKSVFDELRLLFGWTEEIGGMFNTFEISLDSGATWADALAGSVAPPVDLGTAAEHMVTHVLTSITGSQWIGFRIDVANPDLTDERMFRYAFQAFLYNSTDNPF